MTSSKSDKRAPQSKSPLLIVGQPKLTDLPTVRALDDIWNEVQSRPLWAPTTFWKWFKLNLRMRTRLIDEKKVDIIAPRYKVNECASCTDNCCIGPHSTVLLRLRDIATLIDLDRTELMTHEKPKFSEDVLASRHALKRQTESRDWNEFPVLKQNSFHACGALDIEGRCTLYPHWPETCARFPYSLDTDNLEVFYSRRCDSFWVRPDAQNEVHAMREAAVAAYNSRIKDQLMLAFAQERLRDLGLVRFLRSSAKP